MPEAIRSMRLRLEIDTNKRTVTLDETVRDPEHAVRRVGEFLTEHGLMTEET